MDIDTMEAGREMDALVAEKVMGWKAQIIGEGHFEQTEYYDGDTFMCYGHNWHPSTDIADAIKLWQKFRGNSMLAFEYSDDEAGGVMFVDFPGPNEIVAESGERDDIEAAFCLATCRAALKSTEMNHD